MAADKLTKKELRAPDAFQKAGAEARGWIGQHEKTVVLLVGALVLVGGGVGLASFLSTRGEERAGRALSEALKVMERPVQAQGLPEPGNDAAPFKSEKEKAEAVQKALVQFRTEYKGSRAAATAALPLAQAEYKLGNYDQALGSYQEYVKHASPDEPLRATALEGTGYAYEAKGQLNEAMAAFEQLARENKTEFLNAMGLYHQARILIQQNKKEEAARRLSEIPDAAPDSAAARMAKERLAVLVSEGVPLPVKAPKSPSVDAGQ